MSDAGVPLLDLQAQYRTIRDDMQEALARVCDAQRFILGPEVDRLEAAVAEHCQVAHCIGVSSGTDALLAVLMAWGIGPGDEVVTSPYTFFATAGSIARVGATPVFADIDPVTYNLDPAKVESAITPRTKAIIPVHLFGLVADMDAILDIARRHKLLVLEDAAQAIGAERAGKRAGSFGDAATLSFFPSKNLGGFGDSGAVLTNDDTLARKVRAIRTHGGESEYMHKVVGGNFRIDALQAAVLNVKLPHLDSWNEARIANARDYNAALSASGFGRSVACPFWRGTERHVFHQYVIRAERRDALKDWLGARGIGCKIYYPMGLHQQQCFAGLGYGPGSLPATEAACRETLALPIYPELTAAQKARVIDAIGEFYQQQARRAA